VLRTKFFLVIAHGATTRAEVSVKVALHATPHTAVVGVVLALVRPIFTTFVAPLPKVPEDVDHYSGLRSPAA
jgi:uncharacterized membrane protein YvlD (DUF360 family)